MWVITPSWSSGSWRSFLYSSVYSCHYNNSVQFSCSIMSDSWLSHKPQHARPPCPSPTPRVCSDSCLLSWWCHAIISSSVARFSSCLQSFPASRSFPMSQFFASGGQSFGASSLPSVLPMNIQGWFSLGLTALVSLLYKELSRSLLQHHSLKASILWCSAQPSLRFNSHIHTQLLEKPWLCLYGLLLAKWCLCSLICCLGLS